MTATPMSSMPAETTAVARCGDGVTRRDSTPEQEGYEECDDGNDVLGDGCSPTCRRNGAATVGSTTARPAMTATRTMATAAPARVDWARRGDGILRAGEEQCDDGNNNDNDACTSDCAVARCGDGHIWQDREFCDDGN